MMIDLELIVNKLIETKLKKIYDVIITKTSNKGHLNCKVREEKVRPMIHSNVMVKVKVMVSFDR
jgi:hypothetical protein